MALTLGKPVLMNSAQSWMVASLGFPIVMTRICLFLVKDKNFSLVKLIHTQCPTIVECITCKLKCHVTSPFLSSRDLNPSSSSCCLDLVKRAQLTFFGLYLSFIFSLSFPIWSHDGSGSGGYLHHVATLAAKHILNVSVDKLQYNIIRSQPLIQSILEDSNFIIT